MSNIKKLVISSLFWKLLERSGTQGVQFIVQIILARLLLPKDYGLIALTVIFIGIASVFVQSGFNTALIQKKDADQVDFSSIFYLSLFIALILYIMIYTFAPFIAEFYNETQLIKILRVLSFSLFFGAINSIQIAVLSRKMQFKRLFFSSTVAIIISGIVGIIMAYQGFGVWSLVIQQLANQICIATVLWFTLSWRPILSFSFIKVKSLFSYGWKILISSLIDHIYMDLSSLTIGKLYTPEILGYYNRGNQFPNIIVFNINNSIQSVMFPAFSLFQDDIRRLKEMVRRSIVTSTFLLFPLMIGLVVSAKSLVLVLLTEKWLPSVPYLQIFCFSYVLWPIHTANLQAIKALGRSDIFLKLEIVKKALGVSILIITVFISVKAIAIGIALSGLLSTFINAYPNKKLLDYGYKQQISDILPSALISVFIGVIVYFFNFLDWEPIYTLIIQYLIGLTLYITISKFLKLECFEYIIDILKKEKKGL